MSRAYLLIAIPAAIVGIFYFVLFHGMGVHLTAAPFIGAIGGFAAAVWLVRHYQRRKIRRRAAAAANDHH